MKINKKNNKKLNSNCNGHDHKLWNRRSFLQALGFVGGGSMLLNGSNITAPKQTPLAHAIGNSEGDRVLLIIRLRGGNDGLNTIIPLYDYDRYRNIRPTLSFDQDQITNLTADFGIPNFMNPLESLWNNGAMKVIHGVGYENINQSHFRGSDIVDMGSDEQSVYSGIYGRYFQKIHTDYPTVLPDIPPAIQVGMGDLLFQGDDTNFAFTISSQKQLSNIATSGELYDVTDVPNCTKGNQLSFVRNLVNSTYKYAGLIKDSISTIPINPDNTFPDTELGKSLQIISQTIKAGMGTKVYLVNLDGFDTHKLQAEPHQDLLTDLSASVKAFYDDLETKDQKVLTMTMSEFGRRPFENGSKGTDHGKAAPTLLFGPAMETSGFLGEHPDLTNLDSNGDLRYSQDYKDILATVLRDWLCVNPDIIDDVFFDDFNTIDLGFRCDTLSNNTGYDEEFKKGQLIHRPIYKNGGTHLYIKNSKTEHTEIKLYNLLGQEVKTLLNEFMYEGERTLDISNKFNTLQAGQYIYRISKGSKSYSKSIMLM